MSAISKQTIVKTIAITATSLLLACATYASEGGSSGTRGGGNAVVCYSPSEGTAAVPRNMVSVEMFDYWEQPQNVVLNNLQVDLGPPSLSVSDKIHLALSRLQKLDPARASRYYQEAVRILDRIQNGQYLTDLDLSVVPDDDSRIQPSPPCYKTQFAIQVADPLSLEKKLQISRTLWTSSVTSNDTKAGLLLHEIIYSDALAIGAKDSDGIRYFNFLLATHYFDTAGADEYSVLLHQIGIEPSYAYALPDQSEPLQYSNSDETLSEIGFGEMGLVVAAPYHWENSSMSIDLAPGDLVGLDVDSENNLYVSGIKCYSGCGERILKVLGQKVPFAPNPNPNDFDVTFHENGVPLRFFAAQNFTAAIGDSRNPSGQKMIQIQGPSKDCGKQAWTREQIGPQTASFDSSVELYTPGNLHSACFAEDTSVEVAGKSGVKTIQVRGHFDLDFDQNLTDAYLARPVQILESSGPSWLDFRARFIGGMLECEKSIPVSLPFPGQKIAANDESASEICEDMFHNNGFFSYQASDPLQCASENPEIYSMVTAWKMNGSQVTLVPALSTTPNGQCPYLVSLNCFNFTPTEVQ